jgi:predicted Fe-Mo cluster-binding NifX family protein
MKIAVTSNNGRKIDPYSEKNNLVFIVNMKENQIRSITKRETSYNPKFFSTRFERIYDIIKDCNMLVTKQIDPKTSQRLTFLGIQVKRAEGDVMGALKV